MGFTMSRDASACARGAQIEAVITRADGTVEHLGVIAEWHRNPLRRWCAAIKRYFSRFGA